MTQPLEGSEAHPDVPLLSSDELAAKLNISSRCVLNWLYSGIIPAKVRVGKVIRFCEADVMAALEEASAPLQGIANPVEITHLALWQAAPDLVWEPSWLLLREPTKEEAELAGKTAAWFRGKMEMADLDTPEQRLGFVKGAMDAAWLEESGFWKG